MAFWENFSWLGGTRMKRNSAHALNQAVLMQVYLLMAVAWLGYLALTWSTVVLLGGFVTALGKKDFWCLTAISMIQAARIFNDMEELVAIKFFELVERTGKEFLVNCLVCRVISLFAKFVIESVLLVLQIIYLFGSVICIMLLLWRIGQRDYGNDGDSSKANLTPALDIFYSMVLCQGALFFLWMKNKSVAKSRVFELHRVCNFPEKWGSRSVVEYLHDTQSSCWRDPASIKGRRLINYAADLLVSESQEDYLSGARMLDVFSKQGEDERSLLLSSRPKIQKLVDTMGWRSGDREIRELAAKIVAHLASDIHLSQFPGAIHCISSLLDTIVPYWNNHHQSPQRKLEQPKEGELEGELREAEKLKKDKRMAKRRRNQEDNGQQSEVESSIQHSQGDGWNELILQGMTILERLASNQHNCREVCSSLDLLPKIMTTIYSDTLVQDINASASWADVVKGSFRVVHQLMRTPNWTGRKLTHEISSSEQAVSNLEKILDQGHNADQELQMQSIEILTELAFDSSTNLTMQIKERLIKKQLHIFLADVEGRDEKLKAMAGKTLALLCNTELLSKTGSISVFTMSIYNCMVYNVTDILHARNKIIYRTIAAEILENLCTHHTMDKEHVKNNLLPKVLIELKCSERESPIKESERKHICCARLLPSWIKEVLITKRKTKALGEDEQSDEFSSEDDDEENKLQKHKGWKKSSDKTREEQTREKQTAMTKLQEAFLSLTLVIHEKLIRADDFDVVARMIAPGEGGFAANLTAIIDENCQATADCVRIVKLCGRIAISVMQQSQYIVHFKDQKFVESLSKASKLCLILRAACFSQEPTAEQRRLSGLFSQILLKKHSSYLGRMIMIPTLVMSYFSRANNHVSIFLEIGASARYISKFFKLSKFVFVSTIIKQG